MLLMFTRIFIFTYVDADTGWNNDHEDLEDLMLCSEMAQSICKA